MICIKENNNKQEEQHGRRINKSATSKANITVKHEHISFTTMHCYCGCCYYYRYTHTHTYCIWQPGMKHNINKNNIIRL